MAPRRSRVENEERGLPMSSVADILKRRGWWGIAAFFLVLVPAVSLVRALPDVYRSGATILIERQQIPDELVRSTVTSALEVRMQTIKQEILSRARLEDTIAQFALYQDLKATAPMEAVIDKMRNDVQIDLRGDRRGAAVAFTVSYQGRDPQKVALVANALTASYIEENLKIRERQAAGTAGFLRGQVEDLARKLEEQEKKVGEFKARNLGQLPEQLDANLQTLEQLTTQLRLNGDALNRANERRSIVERDLAAALGTTVPMGPDAMAMRLAQLRATLASLQTRYSDKHPDVQRIKAEIASLESTETGSGSNGTSRGVDPALAPQVQQLKATLRELDLQTRTLQTETESLKQRLNAYQARVESIPRVQQQYQILAREYETTKEMYRSLTVRQRESALAESMEQRQKGEQFRVIEPALPSESPAAPRRQRLFALALLLALGLAAAVIVGPEALDSTVHTPEQLQARFELPVLVSIPTIVVADDLRRTRVRFGLAAAGVAVAVTGLTVAAHLLARENSALTAMLMR